MASNAQNIDKGLDSMQRQMAKGMASLDSSMKLADSMNLVSSKHFDSVQMARQNEQNNRNLDGLLSMMNEREQKQKQGMWMRIIFGLALLGVGIFGILRKRKKKDTQ